MQRAEHGFLHVSSLAFPDTLHVSTRDGHCGDRIRGFQRAATSNEVGVVVAVVGAGAGAGAGGDFSLTGACFGTGMSMSLGGSVGTTPIGVFHGASGCHHVTSSQYTTFSGSPSSNL